MLEKEAQQSQQLFAYFVVTDLLLYGLKISLSSRKSIKHPLYRLNEN